jgi:hypothetical protein
MTPQVKEFDTNSNYDNTTNYRFQPTVAGYYQITVSALFNVAATSTGIGIYKNGGSSKYTNVLPVTFGPSYAINGTALIYMNGTTDYVEAWIFSNGTSPNIGAAQAQSYFQGFLARAA